MLNSSRMAFSLTPAYLNHLPSNSRISSSRRFRSRTVRPAAGLLGVVVAAFITLPAAALGQRLTERITWLSFAWSFNHAGGSGTARGAPPDRVAQCPSAGPTKLLRRGHTSDPDH